MKCRRVGGARRVCARILGLIAARAAGRDVGRSCEVGSRLSTRSELAAADEFRKGWLQGSRSWCCAPLGQEEIDRTHAFGRALPTSR